VKLSHGADSNRSVAAKGIGAALNTIEFLGIWEFLNNPDFKPIEFDGFRKLAGLNSFTLTPKNGTASQLPRIAFRSSLFFFNFGLRTPDFGLSFWSLVTALGTSH
jgi:hypothetical protein